MFNLSHRFGTIRVQTSLQRAPGPRLSSIAHLNRRYLKTSISLKTNIGRFSRYSPWSDVFFGSLGARVFLQAVTYSILLYGTVQFVSNLNASLYFDQPPKLKFDKYTVERSRDVFLDPVCVCKRTQSSHRGIAKCLHRSHGCFNGPR